MCIGTESMGGEVVISHPPFFSSACSSAILLSMFVTTQRDYIHKATEDRGYRVISLFDMFHKINKKAQKECE